MTKTMPFSRLGNSVALFWKAPKKYLYLFVYPTDKTIQIKPYSPKAATVAKAVTDQIKRIFPALKISFVGSAGLGIDGIREIDLIAQSPYREFYKYSPGLASAFGAPNKVRQKSIQWNFKKDGYLVDFTLIDPSTAEFRQVVGSFETLKKGKSLLQKYEDLKNNSEGLSVRAYQRRKLEFFTENNLNK